MIARTIRMLYVSLAELESEQGWTAPIGWRIVNSERRTSSALVTIVKS